MVQLRDGLRLALEAVAQNTIVADARRQYFDGDGPIQPRVTCTVDLPHAAGADGRNDFVRPEARTGSKGHVVRRNSRIVADHLGIWDLEFGIWDLGFANEVRAPITVRAGGLAYRYGDSSAFLSDSGPCCEQSGVMLRQGLTISFEPLWRAMRPLGCRVTGCRCGFTPHSVLYLQLRITRRPQNHALFCHVLAIAVKSRPSRASCERRHVD
jgi:hypothetical protein